MKIKEETYYTFKDKETCLNFLKQAQKEGLCWAHNPCSVLDMIENYDYYTNCNKIERLGNSLYWTYEEFEYPVVEWKPFDQHIIINITNGIVWGDGIDDYDKIYDVCTRLRKLQDVENLKRIEVVDGVTTITTRDGKTAEAKCNPEDDFDVVEGVKVALKHLNAIELTPLQTAILKALQEIKAQILKYDEFRNKWLVFAVEKEFDFCVVRKELCSFNRDVFKGLNEDEEYLIADLLFRSSNR